MNPLTQSVAFRPDERRVEVSRVLRFDESSGASTPRVYFAAAIGKP